MKKEKHMEGELIINSKKQERIEKLINKIEKELNDLKSILVISEKNDDLYNIDTKNAKDFIMGIFDGKYMIDENGKKYEIPENYASKSKLVTGDQMKLVISNEGNFIYKLIKPIERIRETGQLIKEKDEFKIKIEDKKYKALKASITYFQLNEGDEVTVLLPKSKKSDWVCIENKK